MASAACILLVALHIAGAVVGSLSESSWISPQQGSPWWFVKNTTQCDACDVCQRGKQPDKVISVSDEFFLRSLTSVLRPFVPASKKVNNSICRHQSLRFLQEVEQLSVWALRMHDSTAKLPSGILNGNVNQYGDYDECLKISSPDGEIRGQYCLAYLQVDMTSVVSPKVQAIYQLMRSYDLITSDLDDPGHRIPRFSSINWGLCVPAGCDAHDVQEALAESLQPYIDGTGLVLKVRVQQSMCQTQRRQEPPSSFHIASVVFLGIILISVIATVADVNRDEEKSTNLSGVSRYLHAFSLRRNGRALVSRRRPADDLESLHGIRFLNAIMLLLSHKSMALFYDPYIDRTDMAVYVSELWSILGRGANLYTDPFIMMSGLLTAYNFTKTLNRRGSLDVPCEYASRILRLMPNLVAIIVFCTCILPWLGSGPQWNLLVSHHADICKRHWWRNLLFIHNYFGFQNMCLTHTHHVGIDMQLFFASPFLVWALWRSPRLGLWALLAVAGGSTALRYYATIARKLTHFVYYGTSVSQLFQTADYSYILPTHRATVYVLGILLGCVLVRLNRDFKLKERYESLGWAAVALLFYCSFLLPAAMARQTYVYDAVDAAIYSAFAPVAWCLCFAWLIVLCHAGRAGVVRRFLCWDGFLITTRLSYALYLTQFPIFFYNVGSTRTAKKYSIFLLFNFFETIVIILATVSLTIFIDMPFQNLRNIIFKRKK